jgi:hypothetical protein
MQVRKLWPPFAGSTDAKRQVERRGTIVKGNGFPSRMAAAQGKQIKDIPVGKFGI